MSDETEHATLCFALASAYEGVDRGPGVLELDGALDVRDLIGILELVIEERCIGETSAALEAAESAQHASDPVVAGVLTRIAADEQRHAELAWATLKWALEAGGADARMALREAFERTLEHASRRGVSPASPDEAELVRHGVFSDRFRDGVRRAVIDAVVVPTFAALWASVAGADPAVG